MLFAGTFAFIGLVAYICIFCVCIVFVCKKENKSYDIDNSNKSTSNFEPEQKTSQVKEIQIVAYNYS